MEAEARERDAKEKLTPKPPTPKSAPVPAAGLAAALPGAATPPPSFGALTSSLMPPPGQYVPPPCIASFQTPTRHTFPTTTTAPASRSPSRGSASFRARCPQVPVLSPPALAAAQGLPALRLTSPPTVAVARSVTPPRHAFVRTPSAGPRTPTRPHSRDSLSAVQQPALRACASMPLTPTLTKPPQSWSSLRATPIPQARDISPSPAVPTWPPPRQARSRSPQAAVSPGLGQRRGDQASPLGRSPLAHRTSLDSPTPVQQVLQRCPSSPLPATRGGTPSKTPVVLQRSASRESSSSRLSRRSHQPEPQMIHTTTDPTVIAAAGVVASAAAPCQALGPPATQSSSLPPGPREAGAPVATPGSSEVPAQVPPQGASLRLTPVVVRGAVPGLAAGQRRMVLGTARVPGREGAGRQAVVSSQPLGLCSAAELHVSGAGQHAATGEAAPLSSSPLAPSTPKLPVPAPEGSQEAPQHSLSAWARQRSSRPRERQERSQAPSSASSLDDSLLQGAFGSDAGSGAALDCLKTTSPHNGFSLCAQVPVPEPPPAAGEPPVATFGRSAAQREETPPPVSGDAESRARLEGLRGEFRTLRAEVQRLHLQLRSLKASAARRAAGETEEARRSGAPEPSAGGGTAPAEAPATQPKLAAWECMARRGRISSKSPQDRDEARGAMGEQESDAPLTRQT